MQQGLGLGEVHALVIAAGGEDDETDEAQQEEGDLQDEGDPTSDAIELQEHRYSSHTLYIFYIYIICIHI